MNTPRTDALIDSGEITRGTTAAAVRAIETELEAMTKERDILRAGCDQANAGEAERLEQLVAEREKLAAKTTECAELAGGIMEGIERLKAEREKVEKLRRVLSALYDAFPQSEREDAWCRATFENAAAVLEETK